MRELLPNLIDVGLDAINPVQISCARMDAMELKAEFGKDMVFCGGGCDTQTILPYGTPAEVRRHVSEQVRILGPEGGFIFFYASLCTSRCSAQNSGPGESLVLSRKTLAFSTSCRFIPAHKRTHFFQTVKVIAAILRAKVRRASEGFIPLASKAS